MKVVVIGCTHAGTAAVQQLLTAHPDTEVTVYERNDNISFLSCGISLYLNGDVQHLEDMFYAKAADLEKLGATVRLRHDVLKVDHKNQTLLCQNLETGAVLHDTYDRLIMATGSYVVVPPLFGIEDEQVLLCKNYLQAKKIYQTAQNHHRNTIVGGGYVGVELAESYARTQHDVCLIQSPAQILDTYVDAPLAAQVAQQLAAHGVQVHLNERVTGFSRDDTTNTLLVEVGAKTYPTDLVIVCTGFVPNTDLLYGQVTMNPQGALIVNDYMQTSDPHIFAAGDACASYLNPAHRNVYLPVASAAVRQGRLAATNLFGPKQKNMGTQGTTAMMIFDHTLASTGLTYAQAKAFGFQAGTVTWQGDYRPAYMPSTAPLTIVLVYDRSNRQILGAQFFSKHEVAQSANTLSVCIQNQNTIDELAFVDMLFQPNFDEPFNYLNQVAQLAQQQEKQAGTTPWKKGGN